MPTTAATVAANSYSYDAADRLSQASTAVLSGAFSYDAAGQLASVTNPLTNQGFSFNYDPNGNRIRTTGPGGVTATYTYDQANRLNAYAGPVGGAVNAAAGTSIQASYSYNGDGLRADLVWDLAEGMPLVIGDGTHVYLTGPGGLPLEQADPTWNSALYYHQDQLGSTRALTNLAGSVVLTYTYDPYGNDTASRTGVVNPFQFAGQYTDAATGLIYLRARYYDSVTGQFLSRDPIVALTHSAYSYGDGDPLNNVDPTGLCSINPFSQTSCLRTAAHWVAEHPLQTAGIVVGAIGLVTGVGAIADWTLLGLEPGVLGVISTVAAGAGTGLDLPGCIRGSTAACVGVFANGLAGLLGGGALWAGATQIGQLARWLSVEGLGLGVGATAWDAAHSNQALACPPLSGSNRL